MDGSESPPISPIYGGFGDLSDSENEQETSLEENNNINAVQQDGSGSAVTHHENYEYQQPQMHGMNGHAGHHMPQDEHSDNIMEHQGHAQRDYVPQWQPGGAPPAPIMMASAANNVHENSNAAPYRYRPGSAVLEDHSGSRHDERQMNINTSEQQQQSPQHLAAARVSLAPTPAMTNDSNHQSNGSNGNQNQLKRAPENTADTDVIELLDDDDDDDDDNRGGNINMNGTANNNNYVPTMNGSVDPQLKRPRIGNEMPQSGAMASYQSRSAAMPSWMQTHSNNTTVPAGYGGVGPGTNNMIIPGRTLGGYNTHLQQSQYAAAAPPPPNIQPNPLVYPGSSSYHRPPPYVPPGVHQHHHPHVDPAASYTFDTPDFVELPSEFVPTWRHLIPEDMVKPTHKINQKKAYQLSLISLTEFTITGLPLFPDGPPTPVAGLRKTIKQISKDHSGKAIFEKDRGRFDGRWKIPIGAYHSFVAYLQADPKCIRLEPIPQMQLKIASLGAAREEKGLPSAQELNKKGVPLALSKTLAPFQRGGVDFVLERAGRALIADEMGLGKTIQAVASMSVYHKEWPLLVLTPSGARYHWESEFRNWLGVAGAASKKHTIDFHDGKDPTDSEPGDDTDHCDFNLLSNDQINVLTSSKVKIFPNPDTRVVICSYGLAPMLAEQNKITPGMFPCAIADESHMLKNIKSKRTSMLVPILNACNRVVLLSGTPALAKPVELWPQLQILQISGQPGFWDNEQEFQDKYVKRNNATHRAELATMLKGTVMIRRMKDNILKDMPRKVREKAFTRMASDDMKRRMQDCMELLREGKGVLGKLARQHSATITSPAKPPEAAGQETTPNGDEKPSPIGPEDEEHFHQILNDQRQPAMTGPEAQLEQEIKQQYQQGQNNIRDGLLNSNHLLDPNEVNNFVSGMERDLRSNLRVVYLERLQLLRGGLSDGEDANEDEAPTRATVLSKMYSLTGQCKVPPVAEFLKKWLNDPTKGKICVFAHHIFVLNEISSLIGLSNSGERGTHKFIRIDGSTSPRSRQEQIDAFQNDPSIRVAMLGITAAGVAVTLTASSQVLFAELFWTPAIMIQAEDRCHRIGQQARVKCIYFVAKGTLDEILWKLIEKKFKELGEFVEGKEKLKMVVDKVYKNEEELASIFEYIGGDESDNDDDDFLQPDQAQSGGDDVLPLDFELEHDIEELGREEQEMLVSVDRDDDDGDAEAATAAASSSNEVTEVVGEEKVQGRSEEDAIALSDSDDEEESEGDGPSIVKAVNLERNPTELNIHGALPDCKIYKMWLRGPSLGVEIGNYKSRLVVSRKLNERTQRLGEDCKPDVGDILVAVGHQMIPPVPQLDQILVALKRILHSGKPSEFWFAEDAEFKKHYLLSTRREKEKRMQRPKRSDGRESSNNSGGAPDDAVILIDD